MHKKIFSWQEPSKNYNPLMDEFNKKDISINTKE